MFHAEARRTTEGAEINAAGPDYRREVQRQHAIGFSYHGLDFDNAFHVDLLVEGCVVVELKSVDKLAAVHTRQLLTYLRLSDLQVGLLLNFGAGTMKEGLERVVNDLPPAASPRLRVSKPSI